MRFSISAIVVILAIMATRPEPNRYEFARTLMGTRFRIVLYAAGEASARQASDLAFDRIAELDRIMSDYREDSELNRLCRQAGGPPIEVSEDLFRIISISQRLSERSGGAFDITAGPLIRLWRRARRTSELPEEARLAAALGLTGYRKVRLDGGRRAVALEKAGMQLDLGAIAKGYAADAAIALLKARGIRTALVAAGGDIAAAGAPPGREGWSVEISALGESGGLGHLLLRDSAVSTSGDAEQFVEIGGVRYSHIVDPRTGMALRGRSSMTVVAPDATTSDSLATAASVLGPTAGIELVDSIPGAAAGFACADEKGTHILVSKNWKSIPQAKEHPRR